MDSEVFLDTAYAIALANANDQFHAKALQLAKQLRTHKTKLVTDVTHRGRRHLWRQAGRMPAFPGEVA